MNGDQNSSQPPTGWQFNPGDSSRSSQNPTSSTTIDQHSPMPASDEEAQVAEAHEVEWSASEYIAHTKSPLWHMSVFGLAVVLAVIVYFLAHDVISTASIILIAILFSVYGARRPKTLQYRLDSDGLYIQEKYFSLSQFRSFAISKEGAFPSVILIPLKRFMPALTVYYEPDNQQDILQLLSATLPLENHKMDMLDTFLHRIHF